MIEFIQIKSKQSWNKTNVDTKVRGASGCQHFREKVKDFVDFARKTGEMLTHRVETATGVNMGKTPV